MQPNYLRALQDVVSGLLDHGPASDWSFRSIGGGSINVACQVTTTGGRQWFCKLNDAGKLPALFDKESRGLALIAQTSAIRVPCVLTCGEFAGVQVLVLECIREGDRPDAFWKRFGEQLARMHRVTHSAFGLDHDNYMGTLFQDNTLSANWVDFFRERRLQPQVRLAESNGLLSAEACRKFDRLYAQLPGIFPPEPPALLHGDLWSGNFLCDTNDCPVLIDPAVYFGHRSMDLAMTTLFGGFDPAFYEAYDWHYPFPDGYRIQWEIANLYPLLIHLNLFGMGYLRNILHTIQRF